MCLPKFTSHPDEKKDLESALLACLKGVGLTVHVVDGMFDLLVVSPRGHVDSYLEIKVRLKGHSKSCPISPAQWSFLSGHVAPSRMESNLRVLIYDHEAKLYALATASQIKGGIPAGHPKLLHLWPVKLPQAGRSDYADSAAVAMREAASFRR